ncbi:MAG: hypothetical protein Q8S33_08130 [Myxococcales bacterium]|nr:hypothetical protein [Myxococcales bacterium]MDP3500284.1 hypothetical protein [Myxococcales bacterium]
MTLRLIPGLRVHDAVVERVVLGAQSELSFARSDGSRVELTMKDCAGWGAIGLRSQPIVLTVQEFKLEEGPQFVPQEAWNTLVAGDYEPDGKAITSFCAQRPRLVFIDCSFGGSLALLCLEVSVN